MKKLLSIAFCVAAAMSFAATEVEVASVGVTEITIPSGQKNTIIASSFNALGGSTGVTVANLIKTATGLANGDQLMLFRDGKYYTFNWNGTAWAANEQAGSDTTALADGINTALTVGEGLWLIRSSTDGEVKLYLYGTTPTTTETTVKTTAGAWNLIGNPTEESFSNFTGVKGDKIIVVVNGDLREYNYNDKNTTWWYDGGSAGKQSIVKEAPSIAAGVGFWYYTQSEQTITWGK